MLLWKRKKSAKLDYKRCASTLDEVLNRQQQRFLLESFFNNFVCYFGTLRAANYDGATKQKASIKALIKSANSQSSILHSPNWNWSSRKGCSTAKEASGTSDAASRRQKKIIKKHFSSLDAKLIIFNLCSRGNVERWLARLCVKAIISELMERNNKWKSVRRDAMAMLNLDS